MDRQYLLVGILLMFLATYLPRALPLALMKKRITSPFLLAFFQYIPYAVLTALTVPAIFFATRHIGGAAAGFMAAVLLASKNKSMLVVALGGAAAVFLAESLLSLFL